MLHVIRTFCPSKSASNETNVLDFAVSAPLAKLGPGIGQLIVFFWETDWDGWAFDRGRLIGGGGIGLSIPNLTGL